MRRRSAALAYGLVAVLITASGCVKDSMRHTARALEAAHLSRAAAVVRYDREYVTKLESWIEDLKKELEDPDTADQMGLLFALDELADVYAYRAVNFDKAQAVNQEAASFLLRVERGEGTGKIGWYFNRNRRLYPSVIGPFQGAIDALFEGTHVVPYPERGQQDLLKESGLVWIGKDREAIKSIYPRSLITALVEEDLANLKRRVAEREQFLKTVIEKGEPAESSGGVRDSSAAQRASSEELEIWGSLLSAVGDAARAELLLARAWSLKEEMVREDWLDAVAKLASSFVESETLDRETTAGLERSIRGRLRLGVAELGRGRHADGIRVTEEAIALANEYDKGLAESYRRARAQAQVDRWASHFLLLLDSVQLTNIPGNIARMIGVEMQASGRRKAIAEQYGQGGHGLSSFLNEQERIDLHIGLGRAYEAAGQLERAIVEFQKAIEIIERQRTTIRTEVGRIRHLRGREAAYSRLVPLLVKTGDERGAFEFAERARARAFLDLLATGRVVVGTPEETDRYERVVRRQAEIGVLAQAGGLPEPSAAEIYRALRDVRVETGVQAAAVSLEFESLISVSVAKPEEIGGVLGANTALVAFLVGDSETVVFLLQDGTMSAWVRPIGREALTGLVTEIRRGVERPESEARGTSELLTAGARVYRELLAPAFMKLSKRVIYIAPHGPLHYIPFAAIHDGAAYLLDRYTLLTVPSGTALTYLAKKSVSTRGATVVLANPDLNDSRLDLPYADEEATAIRDRRPVVTVLTRAAATIGRLKALAPTAGIVHLAAHATLDVSRPLNSAVLLAPGDGNDGRLTVGEVFGLKLPGSLVVLSACETGVGSLASGDELIGLTRAFIYAGAPHVVATLWRIADQSTAALMAEFYERLRLLPPAEALRQAQLSLRARYPHPFYWAGFSVFGHYR